MRHKLSHCSGLNLLEGFGVMDWLCLTNTAKLLMYLGDIFGQESPNINDPYYTILQHHTVCV